LPNVSQTFDEDLTTPRARETATAKAKANGQRLTAPADAGQPPPLGARSEHRSHALCGRVCLPAFLFREFINLRGGSEDEARVYVDAWALKLIREWGPDGPKGAVPVGEPLRFWRAQWEHSHPTPKAGLKTAEEIADEDRRAFEALEARNRSRRETRA
jgi:hypothetical protein